MKTGLIILRDIADEEDVTLRLEACEDLIKTLK
jgi:hypothetical protein